MVIVEDRCPCCILKVTVLKMDLLLPVYLSLLSERDEMTMVIAGDR